jgi:methyltransferase (TIGR00027 family)
MSTRRALLSDVSDTAYWVAYHRALESERPDALFVDPFARLFAAERGARIAEGMPTLPGAYPGARGLAWGLAVRTRTFDELIQNSVEALGAGAVLNLAAGFDVRPYRLALPASLHWIEADRAHVLAAKAEVLGKAKPACSVERVELDLRDRVARRRLFDRVATAHARVVVVTEGLLVYLDEVQVAALSEDLLQAPSMQRWVLETISPGTLKQQMAAWRPVLAPANAEWKFAPAAGFDFFTGWVPVCIRSCILEARRLGREEMRYAGLLRALSRLSGRFRHRLHDAVRYAVLQPAATSGQTGSRS